MLITRRRALIGIAAPALVLPSRRALAIIHGFPDPWLSIDGRLAATTGLIQRPSLLNGYVPTGTPAGRYFLGQGGGFQPPWHVAGVDYAVGIQPGVALSDPLPGGTYANASLDPFFKTTLGAGINSNGQIEVDNKSNFTMQGWDFSLHGGLNIFFNGCSNFVVKNCNWKTQSNVLNTIISINNACHDLTIEYCVIDGGGAPIPVGQGLIESNGYNTCTYQYNWIKNSWTELIVLGDSPNGNPNHIIQYNHLHDAGIGQGTPSSGAHGDWVQIVADSGSSPNQTSSTFRFNCFFQQNAALLGPPGIGCQGISWNGNSNGPFGNDIATNNVMISLAGSDANALLNPDFSWLRGTGFLDTNYFDTTGCTTINEWCKIASGSGGGSNTFTGNNNINMLTGAKMPTDATGRVNT